MIVGNLMRDEPVMSSPECRVYSITMSGKKFGAYFRRIDSLLSKVSKSYHLEGRSIVQLIHHFVDRSDMKSVVTIVIFVVNQVGVEVEPAATK